MRFAVEIRTERPADYATVGRLIEEAFRQIDHSDHSEHLLVERLRRGPTYIPGLSLVADVGGVPAGFIMMSRIRIGQTESLALAPVAVLPRFQGRGIGTALIREAHARAAEMGFGSVLLIGHADYYPRFGYRPAAGFGIRFPWDAPPECCMAAELTAGALDGIGGMAEYPADFF